MVKKEGENTEGLSSQELNSQLFHLLERLPTVRIDLVSQISGIPDEAEADRQLFASREAQAKRSQGEFKVRFMERYQQTMQHSLATPACRSYLDWLISEVYDSGVDINKRIELEGLTLHNPLYAFMYLVEDAGDNPQTGGVFAEDDVQRLELEIYNRAILGYKDVKTFGGLTIGVITKIFGIEPDKVPADNLSPVASFIKVPLVGNTAVEALQNEYDRLMVWGTQIEHKYGITPPIKPEDPTFKIF